MTAPGVFQIDSELDRVTADIAAGFDIVASSGASVRVEYDGRFGDNTTESSLVVKGELPF